MTACTSCHPDGTSDGSMWSTMEGERRTISLAGGVRGRGWLHVSATHRTPTEFLQDVIPERLGGHPTDADLAALVAYIADGIPAVQPPRVDAARAARGATLFASHCARCHVDDADAQRDGDPALFDVGTAIDDAHVGLPTFFESLFDPTEAEILHLTRGDRDLGPGDRLQQLLDFRQRPARMRGAFKAPALRSMYSQVLFFHDGRFDRLEDAVAYMNDTLGIGLTADQRADVVEYLRGR